jgi:hypothetical protein
MKVAPARGDYPRRGALLATFHPMSPPRRRAPHYERRLDRVIVLKNGRKLRTLQDAADVMLSEFDRTIRWGPLDTTIEKLMEAAASGERDDIIDATDRVRRLLSHLL